MNSSKEFDRVDVIDFISVNQRSNQQELAKLFEKVEMLEKRAVEAKKQYDRSRQLPKHINELGHAVYLVGGLPGIILKGIELIRNAFIQGQITADTRKIHSVYFDRDVALYERERAIQELIDSNPKVDYDVIDKPKDVLAG